MEPNLGSTPLGKLETPGLPAQFDLLAQVTKLRIKSLYMYSTGQIVIRAETSILSGLTLTCRYGMIAPNGDYTAYTKAVSTTGGLNDTNTVITPGEGYLTSIMVRIDGGNTRRGECFIQIYVNNGREVIGNDVLTQGYLTGNAEVYWPDGPVEYSTSGPGGLESISIANPAAGAEISYSIPASLRFKLRALRFTLAPSSAVATRQVSVVLDDGTNTLVQAYGTDTDLASTTRNYNVAPWGNGQALQQSDIQINIPPEYSLLQGWRIRTVTANLQSLDQYSAIRLFVEQWIEV